MSILVGGPFDGREFPARGEFFMVPCRDFYASPPGREPYVVHTVAIYSPRFKSEEGTHYEFQREEVVYDGYVAPVKP